MRKQQRSSNPLPSDILLTLPELGVEVDKVVRDEAWALCPNPKHADVDPSWSINIDTGQHFCFSCGWKGNYLFLVETMTGLNEESSESWIRTRGGIGVARKKLRGEQSWEKKKAVEITEADLALFDTWVPKWALDERDVIQESCEAYGVLWNSAHDRWVLPIRDPFSGTLLGWQEKGKRYFRNVPEAVEKSRTLFGYHLLGETAYLEESPLDCVRLHTYGVDGAVSGYGVHVSEEQINLILEKVDTLVVCLDNDDAGRSKEVDIWQKYRGATRLYFANYEHTDKKDHGEMTPDEIAYSLENKISALRYRPC